MMISHNRRTRSHIDAPLIITVFALAVFGIIAIASATYDPNTGEETSLLANIINSNSASWQSVFVLVAPFIMAVVIAIPYDIIRARTQTLYVIVLGLLVLVLGVSQVDRGIKAWFTLGSGRMLQPAEFAKPAVILMLARVMSRKEVPMATLRDYMKCILIVGIPALCIFVQGEAGTIIVIVFVFAGMMFFSGVRMKVFLPTVGIPLIAIIGLFAFLMANGSTDYRVMRILSFLDPTTYSSSGGYQLLNSRTAIGMGGLTGRGFFVAGTITELGFVPDNWTDFIYSSIGEGTGFIGCVGVIAAYVFLILRMLYLARYTSDRFGQLVITGIASMIFFNAFENIAMSIGLMPITGIPLPFLSYGGSSFMTNLLSIGLVLNVTNNRTSAVPYQAPVTGGTVRRRRAERSAL